MTDSFTLYLRRFDVPEETACDHSPGHEHESQCFGSDVVVPVDPVIEGQEVPAKGLYFSSSFEFELSSEVEDVLQRGITLYFVIEVEVEKKRWYWFDRSICGIKETIRLSFNPLTRSYRVAIGGMTQSFSSLEAP